MFENVSETETNGNASCFKDQVPKLRDSLEAGTYWLTRIVFLRSLGFIYFFAFLIALRQNKQLIGSNGLLPTDVFIKQVKEHFGNTEDAFMAVPSILHYIDLKHLDWWLDALAYAGLIMSSVIVVAGSANMIGMSVLWLLYHSIVNVGQRWYSFGWESQLLETGFLAIFFCPVVNLKQVPRKTPPSWLAIIGYRWLIFRIMIGAGLIKVRGDQCWRDLTCMNYHYQTQPVPNPISYYMHQSPEILHKFETLSNHFIELIAPFLIFLTRPFRITGGLIQILFQVVLIISGNLSFLNWLTIVPSICCLDDRFISVLFPFSSSARTEVVKIQQENKIGKSPKPSWGLCVRRVAEFIIGLLIAYLSIPVVKNLLSKNQAMNTSFDSFRIVNTYGAFGSITKERTEVIVQGTRNATLIPDEEGGLWEEYQFHCKPGNIKRRPCLISPYHYRLDWLMWFAAFQNYQHNPWLIHFAAKLLANDEDATSLIAYNPFKGGHTPRFIRGEHYRYEFAPIGSEAAKAGHWWTRKKIGTYFPAVNLNSLRQYIRSNGWKMPKVKVK